MSPLYPETIRKHLGEDWTLDSHNTFLRIVDKEKDISSVKSILGVIKIKSSKQKNITLTIPDGRNCILEIYTFGETIGHLVESIPISSHTVISTGHRGNLRLPDGYYIPLIRIKGNVHNEWASSIKISTKSKKCPPLPYRPVPNDDENVFPDAGTTSDIFYASSVHMFPCGAHIRRNVWSKEIVGPKIIRADWINRGSKTTIMANVLSARTEKIESVVDGPQHKIWSIPSMVTRNVTIVETIFGEDNRSKLIPLRISIC